MSVSRARRLACVHHGTSGPPDVPDQGNQPRLTSAAYPRRSSEVRHPFEYDPRPVQLSIRGVCPRKTFRDYLRTKPFTRNYGGMFATFKRMASRTGTPVPACADSSRG